MYIYTHAYICIHIYFSFCRFIFFISFVIENSLLLIVDIVSRMFAFFQQSLQDNNSTVAPTTTALLLRDTEMPIVLDNGEETNTKSKDIPSTYGSRTMIKGSA